MFGKRILFLFLLTIFIKFCYASENKHLAKHLLFKDEEIQEDIKAVDLAIQAPWVERNPFGIQRMETKRESFGLSDAQKALFNRHWELETIQTEKPVAPKQLDLELFAQVLDIIVEIKRNEKEVWLRMDKLNEWAKEEEENKNINKLKEEELPSKDVEEKKKESNNEDYMTLSKLFKLDIKENKKEEKEEGQCSENEKEKFIETKPIFKQENRTETIYENINGISGNWWHFKQPIIEKENNEQQEKPFVMVILDEEENKEKEDEDIQEQQNNTVLEESDENEIFDQIQKKKDPIRAERPSETIMFDMNLDNKDFDENSEENEEKDFVEEEEEEEEKQPMVEVVKIIDINDDEKEDNNYSSNSISSEEEEEKNSGILNVLSNLLFGNRFKREAIPSFQIIPNSTKIIKNNQIEGNMTIEGKNIEFSASKWEITKDLSKNEEKIEIFEEIFDNDQNIKNLKKEKEKVSEMDKNMKEKQNLIEKEKKQINIVGHVTSTNGKNVGEKEKIKNEKYKIAKYLSEFLTKTSEERPKRDEKIAYIWYCELQYWLAKRIENDFGKIDGKNIAKILDGMDEMKEEFEFVSKEWGKIIGKLAELTDFIGKEFKRKK